MFGKRAGSLLASRGGGVGLRGLAGGWASSGGVGRSFKSREMVLSLCPFLRRAEASDVWPDRSVMGLGGGRGEEGSGKLDRSSDSVLSLCLVMRSSEPSLELMS